MLDQGHDQAAGLRRMLSPEGVGLLAFPLARMQPARWIARLAHALRALGRKPLVVDASRGAVTSAFGLKPRHELIDLLEGRMGFDAVAQATHDGVYVLRADRGVDAFVASGAPASQLLAGFSALSHGFDELLLAMPAAELACLAGPDDRVPVVALDAAGRGVVDSYSLVKQLAEGFGYRSFACVVEGAADADEARDAHARLADTARRFLATEVEFAGWLPDPLQGGADAASHTAHSLLRFAAAPAHA